MQLTFLGLKYEVTAPEITALPSAMGGKYRGIPSTFSSSAASSLYATRLAYRGIPYLKGHH